MQEENVRNDTKTIGTTAAIIAPLIQKGIRKTISIVNTSLGGQTITLAWGGVASAGAGIVLSPGGSWCESIDNVFKPSNKDIWAIASGANATIGIHERVEGGF